MGASPTTDGSPRSAPARASHLSRASQSSHRPRPLRLLASALTLALALLAPSRARAWYFPEHVVLTSDGHTALAPELRAVIGDAIADARKEGLGICPRSDVTLEEALTDTPFRSAMIRSPASVSCVPYAALPGLAGDHASGVTELRAVLTSSRGIELVSTVAYEWRRFRENVRRGQLTLDRMSFVHDLDVALYFIDADYVTRARATRSHFRDMSRSFERVLRDLAEQGRVDDVTARYVFHHVRSLILAATGKRVEALLEHAFAVHYLQDAFSSGHLVMSEAAWAEGRTSVRGRHDAFNSDGLAVTRAMSHEPCASLNAGTVEIAGLPPCWTTSGDGYLGLTADTSDRLHVAAALSRTELAFAMALDPARIVQYASSLGELALVTLAAQLDPIPWWTVDRDRRRRLPAGPEHAMHLVKSAAAAVERLRDLPLPPAGDHADTRIARAVDARVIASALDPCVTVASAGAGDTHEDTGEDAACGATRALALGSIGVSLLRPTLAQLPTSQVDTTAMRPEGHLDHGFAIQLFASTGAMMVIPPSAPIDVLGPGVGASAGLSYRWGSLLPGRRARSLAEFNVGIGQSIHVDTRGDSGGRPLVTTFTQELRWPVLWEALTTYKLPLDLPAIHNAGRILFLNGLRAHELVRSGSVAFLALELEACAIALSHGHGAHPLYALSPELRFSVGIANPSAAQPSYPDAFGATFGITLTGGYASFL